MPIAKKKITLLICGQPFSGLPKSWLSSLPELSMMSPVEVATVFSQPPADITPAVWLALAKTIVERYKASSGFVVFHGPDNLLYTASALSFLLKNLTKPIIFTGGSITPQADKRLELRANFINALQTASYEFSDIGLMFGNRFIRANQASQGEGDMLNMFSVPSGGMLGKIDFSIRLAEKVVFKNRGVIKAAAQLDTNIEILSLSPFIDFLGLARRLPDRHGVVINAGLYEYLPDDLRFLLEKVAADTPVIIWSRKISPSAFAPKNMMIVSNITWESTVTKFMVVRGETADIKRIKEQMAVDFAGEIIH